MGFKQLAERTVPDGQGTLIAQIIFPEDVPCTVTADVSAGTAIVEYTIDKEDTVRDDPVTGVTWIPWTYGLVTAGALGADSLVGPITALRILPTGGIGTLKVMSRANI